MVRGNDFLRILTRRDLAVRKSRIENARTI
jgi:hypothetical protein